MNSLRSGTLLIDLPSDDKEFLNVEVEMQATVREHRDNGHSGGVFSRYNIVRVILICIIYFFLCAMHNYTNISLEKFK